MSNSSNSSKTKKRQYDTINFYEVFGIEKKATSKEIRDRYRELVKKYHPDKNPDKNPKLFESVQRAWDCLGDEEKKKQYDILLSNTEKAKKSSHFDLKNSFDDFKTLGKSEVNEKSKAKAQLEFANASKEMDSSVGFDRNKLDAPAISSEDIKKRYSDLMLQREQDELEFSQSKLFESDPTQKIDMNKFNAIFEARKKTKDQQIVKRPNGPSAFNDGAGTDFSTLDVYGKTFDESTVDGALGYGAFENIGEDMTDMDINKAKNINVNEYIKNREKLNKPSDKNELERLMKEREAEFSELSNIKFDQFNNNIQDSFMFTHEVGGTPQLEFDNELKADDDEELIEACNRLIALESKPKPKQ